MQAPIRRMMIGLGFFFLTAVVASFGYHLSGASVVDSIYMTVITVFGVGFGEVVPHTTDGLKIFTMFVIVAGCSSVVYIVGGFIQMVTEGELHKALGERAQRIEIEHLNQHAIIVGFGRLGQPLARHLADAQVPFVVVDGNAERAELARSRGYLVVVGNASEEQTLETAGIARAKVLATVLPDDAANVFITLTARTINPTIEIIARGEIAATEKKLRAAGARQVVLPADIGALRIAHMITQPTAVEFLDENESRTSLNAQLEQINLRVDQFPLPKDSPLHDKRVSEIEVLGNGAFLIVGIKRHDGTMESSPPKDAVLHSGDTLIVVGHRQDIPNFAAKFVTPKEMTYRGAKVRQ